MSTPVPLTFSNSNPNINNIYMSSGFITSIHTTITSIPSNEQPVNEPKLSPPISSSFISLPLSTYSEVQKNEGSILENNESSITTTHSYKKIENPEHSLAYRKLKRYELLEAMLKTTEDFKISIGNPQSARHFSMLKDIINETWKYTGNDEYLSMLLSSIDSIVRFNLWRNFNEKQANALVSVIQVMINNDIQKDINIKDVKIVTINLHKVGLNLFPYEDHHNEQKKK